MTLRNEAAGCRSKLYQLVFIIWYVESMKIALSPWFETLAPLHERSLLLYCFPYAGGNSQVYRVWQRHLPKEVSLSLVHLPGRTKRISEPPFTNLKPLVEALADTIAPANWEAYAFWGHSMGALISFELARELRRRGLTLPRALFVSGRGAPQVPASDPPTFNLPEKDFIAELRRLNGTPQELLADPGTVKLFLPTARADFQIVETYLYQPEEPLACSICAYGGLQDPDVSGHTVRAWEEQTSANFKVRMFSGDHFFIHSSANLISVLHRDLQEELLRMNANAR